MKKRIALLSACALLVSLFSLTMLPAAASEAPAKDYGIAEDYFLDFSAGARVQESNAPNSSVPAVYADGNSAAEYDKTVGALKISTKDGFTTADTTAGNVYYYPAANKRNTVAIADYPIFAAKVKLAQTDLLTARGGLTCKSNRTSGGTWGSMGIAKNAGTNPYSQGYFLEAGNDDWQLVVFDAKNTYNTKNQIAGVAGTAGEEFVNWMGTQFALFDDSEGKAALRDGTPETLGWVQWAGAFKTVAQAEEYFNDTTDVKAEAQIDHATLLDYSVAYRTDNRSYHGVSVPTANANTNTAVTYDYEQNAIKISTVDNTNTTGIGAVTLNIVSNATSATVTEYPYLVMKIKLANANNGTIPQALVARRFSGATNTWGGGTFTAPQATTDWQLVYMDARTSLGNNPERTYASGAAAIQFSNGLTTNTALVTESDGPIDLAWIQWIKPFKSLADAELYFGNTADPEKGEIPEEVPTHDPLPTPTNGGSWLADFTQGVNVAASASPTGNGAAPSVYPEANTNTAVSYDANVGALKVSTAEGSTNGTIGKVFFLSGSTGYGKDAKEDYIFAFKMKLIKKDLVPPSGILVRNKDGSWRGSTILPNSTFGSYSGQSYWYEYGREEWQLVTFGKSADATVTHCDAFTIALAQNHANTPELIDGTAEDLAYIQWAGTFKTVADAEAYFAQTTPDYTKINKSSLFFYGGVPMETHYSQGYQPRYMGPVTATANYGETAIADTCNASAVFDNTEKAYKISTRAGITATDTIGQFKMFYAGSGGARANLTATGAKDSTAALPVFAMAVKTARTDLGALSVDVWTNGGGGLQTVSGLAYAETTEWQLVTGTVPKGSDDFGGFLVNNLSNNEALADGNANTLAWVKWGGLFATVEDAEAYFTETVAPEQEVEEEEDNSDILAGSGAAIRKTLYKNAQALRFHHTLKTTMVDGQETVKFEGEDVVVKDVFVLMSTESTLAAIDGGKLTKEAAEANAAKVKQIAITSCRSREVDGDNITYDFTALLSNVKQANAKTYVCARAYILCQKADGEYVAVYGDTQVTSVFEMYGVLGGSANAQFTGAVHTWMAAL